jgi:hypothetical protein
MPVNTSMNRWNRIASNMDIETSSINKLSDPFNKTPAERSQHCDTIPGHKNSNRSNMQVISEEEL